MTKSALEGQCHHFLIPSSPWGTARQRNFTSQNWLILRKVAAQEGLKDTDRDLFFFYLRVCAAKERPEISRKGVCVRWVVSSLEGWSEGGEGVKGVLSLGFCGSCHATNHSRLVGGGYCCCTCEPPSAACPCDFRWLPASVHSKKSHQRFSQSSRKAAQHRSRKLCP